MTSQNVPPSRTSLRAVAPLLVVACILVPLLVLTQAVAEGAVQDIVSLVLVLAIIGTLVVPVLIHRSRAGGSR